MFITPFDLGIGIVFFILSKWMIERRARGQSSDRSKPSQKR